MREELKLRFAALFSAVCLLCTWAEPVDVRLFGAKGDGKTDDTKALQKAVDAGAGDIELPKGVYRLTRPIVIELDRVGPVSIVGTGTARLLMAGPGPALRFLGTHRGTAAPETVKAPVWKRQRMPVVKGIEIVGAHPQAVGIEADGTMQLIITQVAVRKAHYGIHLVGNNRNVIISDCHIYQNSGEGIYLDDVNLHQINISNCHVSYNRGGGIVARAGNVRNIQITGCDIEGNMAPPAAKPSEASPTANILIDGRGGSAAVAEVAVTGCTIQHTQKADDSANIRFIGPEKGIDRGNTARWGNIAICNNVMSDVNVNIDLLRARGVVIAGNVLWKGRAYSIRAVDCEQLLIGPNMVDYNPRYWGSSETRNAVFLQRCRDCSIAGLHIKGTRGTPGGLILEACSRCNVTGCTILDCENAGVFLKDSKDCTPVRCFIRKNPQEAGNTWRAVRSEP